MENDKAKHSRRIVMSSSHVDKHGTVMTKEALESALKFINGSRKPRLGLDHNKIFPPLGRINNGEVFQGKDGAYYLEANQEYYDKKEILILANGLELIRESFSGSNFPFVECEFQPIDKVEIQYDPVNFENYQKTKDFMSELRGVHDYDFKDSELLRKSEIPDPEIVIRITEILAIAIGLGLRKIPEKIGEAIGEDLSQFYKLLNSTIKKSVKELLPKNRPINFVVELSIEKAIVELIVTTRDPNTAIKAFEKSIIEKLKGEIEVAVKNLEAEKVQFVLNEDDKWELNYILTREGKAIGTKKSYKKRDDFFQKMVEKRRDKKNKRNA